MLRILKKYIFCGKKEGDERGVTLVEMTFVLPLFLMIVFLLFDFSRVVTRKTIVSNALRVAVRAAATQRTNCATVAQDRFNLELQRYGLQSLVSSFSAAKVDRDAAGVNIPVLEANAEVEISCFLCPVMKFGLPTLGVDTGQFNFNSRALIPVERGTCQ